MELFDAKPTLNAPIRPITWFMRERSSMLTTIKLAKEIDALSIAVIGSASGEQVYDLASLVKHMTKRDITVDGYDTNPDALKRARNGVYREFDRRSVKDQFARTTVNKFYETHPNYYGEPFGSIVIPEDIKPNVTFSVHDIINEPLTSPVDIILCTNLLYYFPSSNDSIGTKLLSEAIYNISESLNPDGYLVTEYEDPDSMLYQQGSFMKKYRTFMTNNRYIRKVKGKTVPIHTWTADYKHKILAEEASVYVKKI